MQKKHNESLRATNDNQAEQIAVLDAASRRLKDELGAAKDAAKDAEAKAVRLGEEGEALEKEKAKLEESIDSYRQFTEFMGLFEISFGIFSLVIEYRKGAYFGSLLSRYKQCCIRTHRLVSKLYLSICCSRGLLYLYSMKVIGVTIFHYTGRNWMLWREQTKNKSINYRL